MKKFNIFVLFLFLFSCAKSIRNHRELVPTFWKTTLGSSFERKEGWVYPVNEKKIFERQKDKYVYCFIELKGVNSSHSIYWKWFSSKGSLWKESEEVKIESENETKSVIAWDKLELKNEIEEGKWVVVVLLDGKAIDRKEFEIK